MENRSAVQYSAFQQDTIDAIVAHFKGHNNALCADEAGMGKTFVAKGVIEQMADAHLESEIKEKFPDEPDENVAVPDKKVEFFKHKEIGSADKGKGISQRARLQAFVTSVIQNPWDGEKTTNAANKALKDFYSALKNANDVEGQKAFWFRYYKNLPHLLVGFDTQQQRQVKWDFVTVNPLKIEPFRALYICSNLAIAEQNTRKLCPVPQCSNRGSSEKADRLSTIWHFLTNHPTPYLEMYPITATIVSKSTDGTKFERDRLAELYFEKKGRTKQPWSVIEQKLKNNCEAEEAKEKIKETLQALRELGEAESLDKLAVNLVIYDEFQNFGNLIALRNGGAAQQVSAELERTKKIIETLYAKENAKESAKESAKGNAVKSLYLSATPFHAPEGDTDKLGFLGMGALLTLLGGNKRGYDTARNTSLQALESYLYNLGIFRNERYRLLDQNTHKYHRITTSCKGLWNLAYQMGEGKVIAQLLATTPYLPDGCCYQDDEVGDVSKRDIPWLKANHPRYQALRDIALNPQAKPITLNYPADEAIYFATKPSAQPLATLLWIPPTKHSEPLGGVFANYAEYSKTLAFSSLKATPIAVCELLNQEVMWEGEKLDKVDEEAMRSFLDGEMRPLFHIPLDTDGTTIVLPNDFNYALDSFVELLNYSGTNTADARIQYCKDGCFTDMLKEFCAVYPDDTLRELKLALKFSQAQSWCFAQSVDETMLSKGDSDATLRRSFNAPFRPFVAMTTSIGSEGLDFHLYCNRLVHYTAPSSVVSLEQKNGRIDRRNSLAVRRYWVQELQRLATVWEDFTQKGQTSGGLSPHWDSGKENLHYYFLQQKWSNEIDVLDALLEKRKNYRKVLGMTGEEAALEAVNLSPLARKK